MLKGILAFVLTRRTIVLLGLMVFLGGGIAAFTMLNIEAYPQARAGDLEITAQQGGLSAEEMERYYTTPMEVGLYSTPGIDSSPLHLVLRPELRARHVQIRRRLSTSPRPRSNIRCSRTSRCRTTCKPQIQQSSLVGEVVSLPMVGPPHFGLTNLRTVQDWVVLRRLSTIPGVVQVNSWGGTDQGIRRRGRSAQTSDLRRHDPADADGARQRQHQCRRPRDQYRPAVGQHPRRRSDRRRRQRRSDQGLRVE